MTKSIWEVSKNYSWSKHCIACRMGGKHREFRLLTQSKLLMYEEYLSWKQCSGSGQKKCTETEKRFEHCICCSLDAVKTWKCIECVLLPPSHCYCWFHLAFEIQSFPSKYNMDTEIGQEILEAMHMNGICHLKFSAYLSVSQTEW